MLLLRHPVYLSWCRSQGRKRPSRSKQLDALEMDDTTPQPGAFSHLWGYGSRSSRNVESNFFMNKMSVQGFEPAVSFNPLDPVTTENKFIARSYLHAELRETQLRQLSRAHRIVRNLVRDKKYLENSSRTRVHMKRERELATITAKLEQALSEQGRYAGMDASSFAACWRDPCSDDVKTANTKSSLSRIASAEEDVMLAKSRLSWLSEELEFDNKLQKFLAGQRQRPLWKESFIAVRSHQHPFDFSMPDLEPCDKQVLQELVAAIENDLANAQHTANTLRRELVTSRLEQLQQMVSRQREEPFVKACLNEEEISAFPDTGAAANFVSLKYAESHGLPIDQTASSHVTLGNGKTIDTVGTTTSLFSFAGEATTHTLSFNVLRTSVYDVVLGSPFLKATETLTRYAHRIGRRCRDAFSYRICALGTPQRVSGELNGVHVNAVPDTGAEVSLMSASFASQQGFKIDTDKEHCVLLEFADGSKANAAGVVQGVEWRYGDSGKLYRFDVYILPELSVDLLLGDDFLCETNAFVAHEGNFWSGDDVEKQAMPDDKVMAWLFWVIKLARKTVRDQHTWEPSIEERWQAKRCEELKAYRNAKKESELLPEAQRSQFMEPHIARWQQFLGTHPSQTSPISSASSAASSSSNTELATPPPAGAVQNVAFTSPTAQVKPSSKFPLGWFKHDARHVNSEV